MTFIEVMVVLAVIALVGGMAAININKAMQEQRFHAEVSSVLNQLRLAQNLMLILDQDVSVTFREDRGRQGISYGLQMQCPAIKGWDRELTRAPQPLHAIRIVDFKEERDPRLQEKGALELKFFSGGLVMSRGELRLATALNPQQSGGFERYICLPGFPSPLLATSQKRGAADCEGWQQFDQRLTQSTLQDFANARERAKAAQGASESPASPSESVNVGSPQT